VAETDGGPQGFAGKARPRLTARPLTPAAGSAAGPESPPSIKPRAALRHHR
jgi:hypothetical protein